MRVAIIGAGSSGLTAIKQCVDYGFEPICFEKTDYMGGLWYYKPYECQGEPSVMKSTVINTSKEMMAFSDFPPPAEYSNFMHNRKVYQYFKLYAEKFDLLKHVRFETVITNVRRSEDFVTSGRWKITCWDKKLHAETTEEFDAVFLCTGHHCEPYIPQFAGLDEFKGSVLHSHSYKDAAGLEDKNVIVVGLGNSGGDIAVELGRVCSQVYLVTRRGSWVTNRVADHGLPTDMLNLTRSADFVLGCFPNLVNWYLEHKLNSRFDHEMFGLKPAHRPLSQHPLVNDDLPNRIQSGTVIVKPNVQRFTAKGAIFEDGTEVTDIDTVILATGYSFGFPFLEEGVIPVKNNHASLYKYMYPPNIAYPGTLIVVGCIQPLGAIFPIAETQCRLACEVLLGHVQLPAKEEMLADIEHRKNTMAARYVTSRRHTIQVEYISYTDQLASMFGVKPNISWSLWFTDPRLAYALVFGPCLPYHFRLQGPHAWSGARDATLSYMERVEAPTRKTHTSRDEKQAIFGGAWMYAIVPLIIFWSLWVFFVGPLFGY